MERIKIKTDTTKNYLSGEDALMDKGYKKIGYVEFNNRNRTLFFKNGKEYYYVGMEHYNTTIYNVQIINVDDIDVDLYPKFYYDKK